MTSIHRIRALASLVLIGASVLHGVQWHSPELPGGHFSKIATDGSVYLTVGSGYVMRSADLESWTYAELPHEVDAGSVVYLEGAFYAAGMQMNTAQPTGLVLRSADGVEWSIDHQVSGAEALYLRTGSGVLVAQARFVPQSIWDPYSFKLWKRDGDSGWSEVASDPVVLVVTIASTGEWYGFASISPVIGTYTEEAGVVWEALETGLTSLSMIEETPEGMAYATSNSPTSSVDLKIVPPEGDPITLNLPNSINPEASMLERLFIQDLSIYSVVVQTEAIYLGGSIASNAVIARYDRNAETWSFVVEKDTGRAVYGLQAFGDTLVATGPNSLLTKTGDGAWTSVLSQPNGPMWGNGHIVKKFHGKYYRLYYTPSAPFRSLRGQSSRWERYCIIQESADGVEWTEVFREPFVEGAGATPALHVSRDTLAASMNGSTYASLDGSTWATVEHPAGMLSVDAQGIHSAWLETETLNVATLLDEEEGMYALSQEERWWLSAFSLRKFKRSGFGNIALLENRQTGIFRLWVSTPDSESIQDFRGCRVERSYMLDLPEDEVLFVAESEAFGSSRIPVIQSARVDPVAGTITEVEMTGGDFVVVEPVEHEGGVLFMDVVRDANGIWREFDDWRLPRGAQLIHDGNLIRSHTYIDTIASMPMPDVSTLPAVSGWIPWSAETYMHEIQQLGWVFPESDRYLFHQHHGWLYYQGDTDTGQWFYDANLGYLYFDLRNGYYPNLYCAPKDGSPGKWLRYGFGNAPGRWFYVYGEGWKLENEIF